MEFFEIKIDESLVGAVQFNQKEFCEDDPSYGKRCHTKCGMDPKKAVKLENKSGKLLKF